MISQKPSSGLKAMAIAAAMVACAQGMSLRLDAQNTGSSSASTQSGGNTSGGETIAIPTQTAPQVMPGLGVDNPLPAGQVPTLTIAPTPGQQVTPALPYRDRAVPINVDNSPERQNSGNQRKKNDPMSTARSDNWLVEGMQQLEYEDRLLEAALTEDQNLERKDIDQLSAAKRKAALRELEAEERDAKNLASKNDPLAAYLQKWTSTGGVPNTAVDAANLSGGYSTTVGRDYSSQGSSVSTHLPRISDSSRHSSVGLGSIPDSTIAALGLSEVKSVTANPYIDDPLTPTIEATGVSVFSPPPPLPEMGASGKNGDAPVFIEPVDKIPTIKPATPPPTDSLVNDKKYFPQLNRF